MSAAGQPFPRFFVVGGQKCGTTTIYGLLRQQPAVFLPEQKETHFFFWNGRTPDFADEGARFTNRTSVIRREDYEQLFASAGERLCGEVCPTYLCSPDAAEAIRQAAPGARIVAILRHPVERSFSAYRYMKMFGSEKAATFEDALKLEEQHKRDNWQTMSHYLTSSLYAPQLERYHAAFGKENVLTIDFADIKRDAVGTTNRILAFIGAPPLPGEVEPTHTNKTVEIRSGLVRSLFVQRPPIVAAIGKLFPQKYRSRTREIVLSLFAAPDEKLKPETRARLSEFFREDVRQVERLTGVDFAHWIG